MLYDDGEWYEGVLEQPRNANKQFLISFEDGETIWFVKLHHSEGMHPKLVLEPFFDATGRIFPPKM